MQACLKKIVSMVSKRRVEICRSSVHPFISSLLSEGVTTNSTRTFRASACVLRVFVGWIWHDSPESLPQRVMARLLLRTLSLVRSLSCRRLRSATWAIEIWFISFNVSQYTAACLKIATFGAFSFFSTAGTRIRRSSNAFRSSIRLWRSMLLCRLLFSVSSSSSEELLDTLLGDDMHRPTLVLLWYVLWRARFAGFGSDWAVLFRAGFEGGRPRGLVPGAFSLNAVFTVNWKCCWSARLGYVGNAAGLHGFSKVTTSISSSSVTIEGGKKNFFL